MPTRLDIQLLKKAIYKFLVTDANDFKTAIGTHFYDTQNTKKAEDVVYPYGVYQLLPGKIDKDNATRYEKPVIRFSLFDDGESAENVTNLASLLDARFNDCESSLVGITGVTVLSVDRITSLSNIIKTGLGNWQMVFDYEIHIQRT